MTIPLKLIRHCVQETNKNPETDYGLLILIRQGLKMRYVVIISPLDPFYKDKQVVAEDATSQSQCNRQSGSNDEDWKGEGGMLRGWVRGKKSKLAC